MMRVVRLFCVSALGILPAAIAWCDDDVLPRGKTPAPGHKLVLPVPPATAELKDCGTYIANPEAGEVYFSPDEKFMYFLSRQPGESGLEGKSFLYELDLENMRSKRIVSLRIADNAALVGHGNPLEAVTILDFHKARVGCGEGITSGITIKWISGQKIVKSYPQSHYKVVSSDLGRVIADMDQRNIKQLDLNTFQKRIVASFSKNFYPLYFRTTPLQLTGYMPDQHELVRWDRLEKEPSAVLKLKKGMRLVQGLDQFGIVTSSEDGRVLQIKQIKGWSGDVFRGIDIRLPEGFEANRTGVNVDFRSGLCLVQGANQALRREMRQVFIYNGSKGQTERLFKAQDGQYFSQAVFGPNGRKIFLMIRNLQDDSIVSVRIGDTDSSEWRDISISREMERPSERATPDKPSVDKALERAQDNATDRSREKVPGEKLDKPESSEIKQLN